MNLLRLAALMILGALSTPLSAETALQEGLPDYPVGFFDGVEGGPDSQMPTRITSVSDLARIAAPKGVTLQWISWDYRGEARVLVNGTGQWFLDARQSGDGDAFVSVNGMITEIGDKYFILDGTSSILNTPDPGRRCEAQDKWRFEITQNRQYYRLRRFEWCDGLTDYIDIYF